MTIVLLVRHGETDWVGKRLQGRLPGIHLNETGRKQAQETADALQHLPIHAIYSSPLERAMQTAQFLAEKKDLQVQETPGLIEMDYGTLTGKTFKQLWRINDWKRMVSPTNTDPFPGGDSVEDASNRVVSATQEIAGLWDENDLVACFTHADQIRLVVAHYLKLPLGGFHHLVVHTAAVSVVKVQAGFGQVIQMNQVLSKAGWLDFVGSLGKQKYFSAVAADMKKR